MTAGPSPAPDQDANLVSARAWIEVLDRLEADLRALDDALDAGEPVPLQTWTPPRELGPLPELLRERATGIADQLGELQTQARRRLAGLGEQLDDLDRRRRAGAVYGT
jgi:hypothetical protein